MFFAPEQFAVYQSAALALQRQLPLIAGGLIGAAAIAVLVHGTVVPQSRLLMPVLSRAANPALPRVALTFDDGPWPEATGAILDLLKANCIHAAFFVIGQNAVRWPDLVRRMHDEGHIVGNHTFDHHRFGSFRGLSYWRDQLARTDNAVSSIIGLRPALFRPPMGIKSPLLAAILRETAHTPVTWNRRGLDGVDAQPETIVRNVTQKLRAGDIMLLHDGRDSASRRDAQSTVAALPEVIRSTRARELEFVSLSDHLAVQPYRAAATRQPA
ncbi:MAG: polysaccharide deacetylase family protein [Phycisphaerales bacterium]